MKIKMKPKPFLDIQVKGLEFRNWEYKKEIFRVRILTWFFREKKE